MNNVTYTIHTDNSEQVAIIERMIEHAKALNAEMENLRRHIPNARLNLNNDGRIFVMEKANDNVVGEWYRPIVLTHLEISCFGE